MSGHRRALLERQLALVHESAILRDRLERHSQALRPAWAVLDGTRRAGAWLRARPWVPVLALLGVCWVRPRRAWRWAGRAWLLWRLTQRVRAAVPQATSVWAGVLARFRR